MDRNYLSTPKVQRLCHWGLGMISILTTIVWARTYNYIRRFPCHVITHSCHSFYVFYSPLNLKRGWVILCVDIITCSCPLMLHLIRWWLGPNKLQVIIKTSDSTVQWRTYVFAFRGIDIKTLQHQQSHLLFCHDPWHISRKTPLNFKRVWKW